MKLPGENTMKAIIIGIVGMILLFAGQRIALSYLAKRIPPKSGGTSMYLIYSKGEKNYYAVSVDGNTVAAFFDKGKAQEFAQKVGGKVEILSGR